MGQPFGNERIVKIPRQEPAATGFDSTVRSKPEAVKIYGAVVTAHRGKRRPQFHKRMAHFLGKKCSRSEREIMKPRQRGRPCRDRRL